MTNEEKEAAKGAEGKTPYQPSMAELDDPNFVHPDDKGKAKDPDPSEEEKKVKEEADAKAKADLEATEKAKAEEAAKAKLEKPKDTKLKDALDKGEKEEEEEEEEDESLQYWEDVEKLTGEKIEVDFGDVDPITPEGAVIYNKAYRAKGISDFEDNLEKRFPRESKALLIASEGGDPSLLYKPTEEVDYKKLSVDTTTSIEQQKFIFDQSLKVKGLDAENRKDLIKLAEDSGKLLEKSKVGLTELHQYQNSIEKEVEEEHNKKTASRNQLINEMLETVETTINKGDIGNFRIPDADKKALYETVVSKIQEINGQFYLVKPMSTKDLDVELQAEFFKMKKGNLQELVKRRAATENTRKLRRSVASTVKTLKGDNT